MASSHQSEGDELYWKIPLGKLSSTVISDIAEAKEEIHQLLLSDSRDNNVVLGDLFNLYVSTNCSAASEILLDQSQQHHVNFLFEKMNDSLKNSERKYPTLMLFWSIILRQPSWLHTIISTTFFNSFIKCLKVDNDVVVLVAGILIITSLLPSIPSLVGSFLEDFFEIFERVFLFTARKRGFIPDTHLLHLQVGVQVYFLRLYAMYPNSTVAYMKTFYESNHDKEVDRTIELLLRWVKFHPWLITETEGTEVSNSRWKSKEPHDVVIDCEKVSLDPNDCRLQESEVLSLVSPSGQSFSEVNTSESSGILTSSENSVQQTAHDEDRLDTATQTGTSLQNLYSQRTRNSFDSGTDMPNNTPLVASSAMFCSPTTLCSLATPPPSQDTSPTGSTHDISCGNAYSNPSPAYSSANINNIELSNLKAPPTIREHSAGRLNSNSKQPLPHSCVAASGAVEDSIVCGRSTPPISSNGKDGERHKEICLGITEDKKQKDALGIDFGENIISEKESSEIASESGEKDSKSKPSLILFLNKTLEMLVPFTSAACRRCMEEKPRSSSKGKTDWENELSPSQLLDHYLNFGKSLQEKRLNRIPLTSQRETKWTHFGGCPPADEITLLHNELLLLHSEVLFERHKCDLHATRNRRLVGKLFQTNAVREELVAIKDQMKLLAMEIVSLEQSLKEKSAENRIFKEKADSWNSEQQEIISKWSRSNEELGLEKQELDKAVGHFRAENRKLQLELKEAKARISQLENDMAHLNRLENENIFLKSQAEMQAKKLLIMGEREEQYKDLILGLRSTGKNSQEDETKLRIYHKELEDANTLVNEQKADISYLRSHISEVEGSLVKKDHEIRDLKKSIESIKTVWKHKLEGMESKYQTIKKANQRLESEVMSLHSKLDARIRDR